MYNPNPNYIATTPPSGDVSNRIATTAFVQSAIAAAVPVAFPNPSYFPLLNGQTSYNLSLADHLRVICGFASSVAPTTLTVNLPGTTGTGLIVFFTPSDNNITLVSSNATIQSSLGSPTSLTLHANTNVTSLLTNVSGAWVMINPSS